MQPEVSTLPVVHQNLHKSLNRKKDPDIKSSPTDVKSRLPCKNTTCISSNKKCLHSLIGGPYRTNTKEQSQKERLKSFSKSSIGQRVMSAKMLRLKQLQNQLADAHYHLNELANENRLLKALQKRQDSALKRYEGTNAELPRIINSHHEELRVLQTKYKKLKSLHKETCDLLKEKENELQSLQSQNRHLLRLSKDRNLAEREKLQMQVSDLNHRIEQQQETIQALHKKLALESKSLKHQLNVEISKRKEAQKNFEETMEKLQSLEHLLDNREKRLYYSGRLPSNIQGKTISSRSLTALRDVNISGSSKSSSGNKSQNDTLQENLPFLHASDLNDDERNGHTLNNGNQIHSSRSLKTETMAYLEQVRKFRLQKSPPMPRDISPQQWKERIKQQELKSPYHGRQQELNTILNEDISDQYEIKNHITTKSDESKQHESNRLLPREVKQGFYSPSDSESDSENRCVKGNSLITEIAKKSRELHARLTNSTHDTSNLKENTLERMNSLHNEERSQNFLRRSITFTEHSANAKPNISDHETDDNYESDPDIQHQIKVRFNNEYGNKGTGLISPVHDPRDSLQVNNEISTVESPIMEPAGGDIMFKDWKELQAKRRSRELYTTLVGKQEGLTDLNHVTETSIGDHIHTPKKEYISESNIETSKDKEREDSLTQDETNLSKYHASVDNSLGDGKVQSNEETSQLCSGEEKMNPESHIMFPHSEESKDNQRDEICSNVQGNQEDVPYDIENKITNKKETESTKTITELNVSETNQDTDELSNNAQIVVSQPEQSSNATNDNSQKEATPKESKAINYNKEKLLATMKAIDNNENIELVTQEFQKHNLMNRSQITENLYRGLPTHAKRKRDIIKDIFDNDSIGNKVRSSCSKLH